jgi:hypothetical protein
MKSSKLVLTAILTLAAVSFAYGAGYPYQKATVTNVENHEPFVPLHTKATDAPEPPAQYAFDISFHLNCSTYVGRYRSDIEYLPAVLNPNQSVDMIVDKGLLRVLIPGKGEVKMSLIRKEKDKSGTCSGSPTPTT